MTISIDHLVAASTERQRVGSRIGAPRLAVVLPSRGDRAGVDRCLAAFIADARAAATEVVVARSDTSTRLARLQTDYPDVRVVSAPPGASIGQLRAIGANATTADIVDFISEDEPPDSRWMQSITRIGLDAPVVIEREPPLVLSVDEGEGELRWLDARHATRGSAASPLLSVVVTAHFGADVLAECLAALEASDLPRHTWELVVVDDTGVASMQRVAVQTVDRLVRLPSAINGPAYARNRGVDASRAGVVVFVDADIRLYPDALGLMNATFASRMDVAAVVGCYDAEPSHGLVTSYRSLHRRYQQLRRAGEGLEFWSGCAAVRRTVLVQTGGYDEWRFPRPLVDDIELGRRLRARGHSILLRSDIQGWSMRQSTLGAMLLCDLRDHHMLRARVELPGPPSDGGVPVNTSETTCVLLTWIALFAGLGALVVQDGRFVAAAIGCVVAGVLVARERYVYFLRHRSFLFVLASMGIDLLHHLTYGIGAVAGVVLRHVLGEPARSPTLEAFAEVGVRTWPPVPQKPRI